MRQIHFIGLFICVFVIAPLDGFPVIDKQSNDILSDANKPTDSDKTTERVHSSFVFDYWAPKRKYKLNTPLPSNLNRSNIRKHLILYVCYINYIFNCYNSIQLFTYMSYNFH